MIRVPKNAYFHGLTDPDLPWPMIYPDSQHRSKKEILNFQSSTYKIIKAPN